MKLLEKIKEESSPENRRDGQIATVVGATCVLISQSGIIDQRPTIKTIIDIIAGICSVIVAQKAIKTKSDLEIEKN